MTVSNTTSRTSAVGTNTVGQEIAFSFPIAATTDLVVKSRVTTTGVVATLTETTDYTVSINGDSGGTVTTVAAWASTYELWLIRNTPLTQSLDLAYGGSFNAENIEEGFDKLTRMVIDVATAVSDRCLIFPDTDPETLTNELDNSVDRASTTLGFDANGDPEVS